MWTYSDIPYQPQQIQEVLQKWCTNCRVVRNNAQVGYYNIPCSFDIETSSFYSKRMEKCALMYAWALGLNGAVILGRTWEEFIKCYNEIIEFFNTSHDLRLRIYIHNMSFDFQFFRKRLSWAKAFAIDERKIIEGITVDGLEFRCSYQLSGYSLAALAGQLQKYKMTKMVGDLDYSLLRTPETPLKPRETNYIVYDVLVAMAYIQEKIENENGIANIPLTKTGYVRRYCKNMCFYGGESNKKKKALIHTKYNKLISSLTITPEEYQALKRVFGGGFTHANAIHARRTCYNVGSADETSAYPAAEVAEQFPMSKGRLIKVHDMKEFDDYLTFYCCIFNIYIEGLRPLIWYENPLSFSKCYGVSPDYVLNNGRVVSASYLYTTLTDVDFRTLCRFYEWDKIKIGKMWVYDRGYLPTNLIKSVLMLYKDKTELKNVEGREYDYLQSKEKINANYGMMVTDIVRDDILYSNTDGWGKNKPELETAISKYNKTKSRFLSYPWGVFITAYARRNLFSAIYEFGDDYRYSDTDSVKGVNYHNHIKYFERYNANIINKLEKALKFHQLPNNLIAPLTIDGKAKPLGVWEYEGEYEIFKTLGAKRYMTFQNNKLSITVSGVNKKIAVPYILNKCGVPFERDKNDNCIVIDKTNIEKCFELFDDDLLIPADFTGKNTHTYIDEPITGDIVDYMGNNYHYTELSGVHLEPAEYSLSISQVYKDYIQGVYDKQLY